MLPEFARAASGRLPIGFSTLGCPTWSWLKILDFAEQNGFAAVELRGLEGMMDLPSRPEFADGQIEQSKKDVASRGLRISCVSSSANMHDTGQEHEKQLADARRFIDHPQRDRIGLVIPVAPFGRAVPQAPWNVFTRETGIPVIIDGAASFEGISDDPGQYLGITPVALSFHATKSFATAEGGAVISTDLALCERAGLALNFGLGGTRDSATASINGKMSEYHAAVGLAELDGWTAKRAAFRSISEMYQTLAAAAGLGGRLVTAPDVAGCYVLFRCSSTDEARCVQDSLEQSSIGYRLWYGLGMHQQTYFTGLPRDGLATTNHIAPLVLGLPVATDLTEAAVTRIIRALARGCL